MIVLERVFEIQSSYVSERDNICKSESGHATDKENDKQWKTHLAIDRGGSVRVMVVIIQDKIWSHTVYWIYNVLTLFLHLCTITKKTILGTYVFFVFFSVLGDYI